MPDSSLLRERLNEAYLVDYRNSQLDTFLSWKDRIATNDKLIRGEWAVTYPDGVSKTVNPMVMNLADAMPRDVARLVSESIPSAVATAASDRQKDVDNKLVREAISDTHWHANRGSLMIPQWTMDLIITGTAFACVWPDSRSLYPHILRLDPRFCYPDVVNGVLQDVLVVQQIKARVLDRMYPDLNILAGIDSEKDSEFMEVWDYYGPDGNLKALAKLDKGNNPIGPQGVFIVQDWYHELGCTPVAFSQLASGTGSFSGLLDQLGTSLQTKNRAVQYMMDYDHYMIYAPWFESGVENWDADPGPTTVYHGDPSSPTPPQMTRVSPAGPNPGLFNLLQFLDTENRGQVAYPASRQGEVPQSIASGSFVASTQGQLTSVVREVQRYIGDMREQLNHLTFKTDEKFLPGEKPLIRTVGTQHTYSPEKDIDGQYDIQITFGAGAGIDRISTDVRLINFYTAGLISAAKALENVDFVEDPQSILDARETEELSRVILQRFAADPSTSLDMLIQAWAIKKETGLSLPDALVEAQKQIAAQAEAPAPEEAGMLGGPPPTAPTAEGLAAGARPVPPTPTPTFTPPPIEQVFVSQRR